jgi:uncharacterized membrane protein SpoIIM required for sporulation
MTPLQFEARHEAQWRELEDLLTQAETASPRKPGASAAGGARLAALYRRACEQLALAQARAYPVHLTQRIERLAERAHRQIYRPPPWNRARLRAFALVGFPQAVRAHRRYLLAALLLFALPLVLMGWACWRDSGFILHVVDADQVREFNAMYSDRPEAGPVRGAATDWTAFGGYIEHNIGLGFQCFASGLFAGLGSVFFMIYNGLFIGAVGGYLIGAGKAENFMSFVITHSAFELTAVVLAGAAGMRLGHALLAPGRRTRLQALQVNARQAIALIYGVFGLLVIAAAIEAFWSPMRWVPPLVKYGVGGACWALVLAYLVWQGRPAAAAHAPPEAAHAG